MTTGADKRRALGKGLAALLPSKTETPARTEDSPSPARPNRVPIERIHPNPFQPRGIFTPESLAELAQSIRANGIIQPLIVRRHDNEYQLVAGERRWRAAKIAGLDEVPVVVQDVAESQMLEFALVENLQREDLNPMESARAFDRLHREVGLSQEEIAHRTGKDRSTITNFMRLLRLPAEVQDLVQSKRISMGQARAILGLPTPELQIQIAEKSAAQGLSVRQVEALVQEMHAPRAKASGPKASSPQDPNVRAAAEALERALGTRVRIVELTESRGRIEIEYYSPAELDRLYTMIAGQ